MDDLTFQALEKKIDTLIVLCDALHAENEMLKTHHTNWLKERAQLREKNEQARTRVEAMISRLKTLEQEA